jgi:DNA-binding CsgD family transcriptional regulator
VIEFEHGRALLEAGTSEGVRRLADVARRGPEPALRAAAARQLARRLALDGDGDEAATVLRDAVAALPAQERETRLELLVEQAFLGSAQLAGHAEARRSIADEAARARGGTPAERLVVVAAHVLAGEAPSDPVPSAVRLLDLRLHRDYPGGFAVATLTFSAVAMLLSADAPDAAERAMDTLRADAEQMFIPDLLAGALWQQAQIAYQRGELARCELEARAAIEAGGEFAARLATPWLVLARTEQGRLAEAGELLERAGMLGRLPRRFPWTDAVGSRGRLRLAQADAGPAVQDLAEARDQSAAWFPHRVEPPWRPLLVEALVLAGDTAAAAAESEAYSALAARWGTPRARGHLARLRALTAARPRAIALLEEAREHLAASHARLELARCLTELGAHRRAAGERRAARATLRDAHELAHRCGADALGERARAELLLAGGRPRPPAGGGAAALTPAERRVAELAAQGATNREIARRLFLSPKTIEMHLRASYRKLDIHGRDELPVALD